MGRVLHIEKHYRDLDGVLERVNCGVVAGDEDRKIVFANQRLCTWLGYAPEEIEGRNFFVLFPPELHDRLWEETLAAQHGDLRGRVTVLRRKDSTLLPVLVLPQPLLDADGGYLGGVVVIIDLSVVQTAKQAGYGSGEGVRDRLERIAFELHSLGLSAGSSGAPLNLDHPELGELSPREREVLAQLVAGDRVPVIAKTLFISEHTVRNHLKSMYRKLGVRTQSELIERVRSLREG